MVTVHMTYMGALNMFGSQFLCTNMSATTEKVPRFYDHIVGLKDQNYSTTVNGISNKGPYSPLTAGGGGYDQVQKKYWRYPPAICKASVAGPCTEDGVGQLMEYAIKCNPFDPAMTFWNSGTRQSMTGALISNLSITMRAGDVTSFSMEMVSTTMTEDTNSPTANDCVKLLTWDVCSVSIGGSGAYNLSEFTITINNPIIPIFTANLDVPKTLRVGTQEVTGTISSYGSAVSGTQILFSLGASNTYTIDVVFAGPEDAASSGPYINTVNFTGAKDTPVWNI